MMSNRAVYISPFPFFLHTVYVNYLAQRAGELHGCPLATGNRKTNVFPGAPVSLSLGTWDGFMKQLDLFSNYCQKVQLSINCGNGGRGGR